MKIGNKPPPFTETTYNSLNLPSSVTDASGKTTTFTYNSLGKVSAATDSVNNSQSYTYNSMGQNTQVEDALNNCINATYDTLGNVTYLAGPLGGSTTYSYDDIGRLISESTTSGGTVTYGYNELNLRNQLINAKNQNRTYYYNSLGRITGYISPEDSVSYTYDDNGNVLTVTDGNGTVTRTYDALNRIITCTDTYSKTITYVYDAVGNLTRIIYPDNTYVSYAYDENNNLITVTDWSNRVTSYTYDANNRVTGVTKPDGSVTTTVYDNRQRVTSSVERDSQNNVITGFEYTYDDLGRISTEEVLDKNTRMCYTYDSLSRVTVRTTINLDDNTQTQETFTYNAAGSITGDSSGNTFVYYTNNHLTSYNSQHVTYDADGNMLSATLGGNAAAFVYDSANRLISAGGNEYTYNAEDVRIRNLCGTVDTTYTYDTNAKLSRLLVKTTNNVVTKYVYGLGLIGEETAGSFKTYHFDYRGSTVAITDSTGAVTDTFTYDTYGKQTARTGTSTVIFGYNGQDGVVTDANGLIYMRARYYSPELRRFINADIIAGGISEAVTLNRYAYANGNPVSNVDPFGLSKDERGETTNYGTITYNGVTYPIYVPHYTTDTSYQSKWTTIKEYTYSKNNIDWGKVISGIQFDDSNGAPLYAGGNLVSSGDAEIPGELAGLIPSLVNSLNNSISNVYIKISFQKSGNQKRVIITTGSSDTEKLFYQYCSGFPYSVYLSPDVTAWEAFYDSYYIRKYYNEKTGSNESGVFDIVVTMDPLHLKNSDMYYLWISEDNKLEATPIVFPKDSAVIGRRKGVLNLGFEPLMSLPIGNDFEAPSEYKNLFEYAINKINSN